MHHNKEWQQRALVNADAALPLAAWNLFTACVASPMPAITPLMSESTITFNLATFSLDILCGEFNQLLEFLGHAHSLPCDSLFERF